jgi:hypothetical protein
MKNIKDIIIELEKFVDNPLKNLPDDIFYFIGRMTPYINVDLLIKCPKRGVLLTWRNDKYAGNGWHLPGGIIRFREEIKKRVLEVGIQELDVTISDSNGPLAVNEIIINDQVDRSHFISLLYECIIEKDKFDKLVDSCNKDSKKSFFKTKPDNLLSWHEIYKDFF